MEDERKDEEILNYIETDEIKSYESKLSSVLTKNIKFSKIDEETQSLVNLILEVILNSYKQNNNDFNNIIKSYLQNINKLYLVSEISPYINNEILEEIKSIPADKMDMLLIAYSIKNKNIKQKEEIPKEVVLEKWDDLYLNKKGIEASSILTNYRLIIKTQNDELSIPLNKMIYFSVFKYYRSDFANTSIEAALDSIIVISIFGFIFLMALIIDVLKYLSSLGYTLNDLSKNLNLVPSYFWIYLTILVVLLISIPALNKLRKSLISYYLSIFLDTMDNIVIYSKKNGKTSRDEMITMMNKILFNTRQLLGSSFIKKVSEIYTLTIPDKYRVNNTGFIYNDGTAYIKINYDREAKILGAKIDKTTIWAKSEDIKPNLITPGINYINVNFKKKLYKKGEYRIILYLSNNVIDVKALLYK